jgi:ACS family pantothenate transporter-like MFS transporter
VEVGGLHPVRVRWGAVWHMYGVSIMPRFHSHAQLMILRWAHEICTHDNEERAIVVATMNEMAYVLQAWLPLIVWQQVDAPQYRKGFITVTFLSAALIVTAIVIRVLHAGELSEQRKGQEVDHSQGSSSSEEDADIVVAANFDTKQPSS